MKIRAIVGVVDGPEASDGLDTPGWMQLVADSDVTARVLAKARRDGEQLREARASADRRSVTVINGMRDRADQASERWQPGVTWEWWTTASRSSALAAYIAALESSEIDGQASTPTRTRNAPFGWRHGLAGPCLRADANCCLTCPSTFRGLRFLPSYTSSAPQARITTPKAAKPDEHRLSWFGPPPVTRRPLECWRPDGGSRHQRRAVQRWSIRIRNGVAAEVFGSFLEGGQVVEEVLAGSVGEVIDELILGAGDDRGRLIECPPPAGGEVELHDPPMNRVWSADDQAEFF